MGSLDEGGSSGDIINSENVVQWSQHDFADRWNVDDVREREGSRMRQMLGA